METRFIPSIVFLSVAIAIFASYVALNLVYSVTQAKGKAQAVWLASGAIAMGFGIWSMHFVGMLAFEMPGMEMAYDIPLMILSVLVAVGASAVALYIVSRPIVPIRSVIYGGIAMAAAIDGMHYIGMFSMRMAARVEWNFYLVALSVLIALVASFAALFISIRLRNKPDRHALLVLAGFIMGIAIAGMHYTGMFAATFIHDETAVINDSNLLVTSSVVIAVFTTTLLILGLALASSVGLRLWKLKERQTEAVITKTEERFRLLIEAVKDYAIFMLNPDGIITTWNSGAERITGYSDKEIIGKHVSTLYRPEDAATDAMTIELATAIENGHFESEGIRLRKDKTEFVANIVVTPLFDSDDNVTGFSKVIRDITQLKNAEKKMKTLHEELEKRVFERTLALQERESQLRAITDALPVLIAQLDRQENFLFANDAFSRWFSPKHERIIGLRFKDILGDRYDANAIFIKKVLAGEVVSFERQSKGLEREAVLSVTFVPEFDERNRVKGFIVLATDITKHKEIEAELKNAKEAAEVANMTKSAFLANMSHEIRTPLGAVLGFSELLFNDDISHSEKFNNIEIIKRNGRLLSNLINDILDLSKVEAGKLEIEKVDVPFGDLLNEITSLLSLDAEGKGIKLIFSSEGPIPQSLKTDPIRLRQILFNIIGNAIKFTEKGSVEIKMKLEPHEGHTKLAFYVTDTGAGIKSEQVTRLFSPFMQADPSTTRKFGGTGLGLVLSKKLAHALGGDVILLKTVANEGSTFLITIDPGERSEVLFDSRQLSTPKTTQPSVADSYPALSKMRILVVDDSLDNQFLIKKLLTMAGAIAETANNGKEGVEKAMSGDFKVILMDLQMPEMDGYEATKKLRSLGFSRPIIALTAHAMKEERRKCLEGGFNDHLTKPIERKSLLTAISQYL